MGVSFSNMFPKYAAAYILTVFYKGMLNSQERTRGEPLTDYSIQHMVLFIVLLVLFDGGIHGPRKVSKEVEEANAGLLKWREILGRLVPGIRVEAYYISSKQDSKTEALAGDTGSTPEPVNTIETRDEKPAEPEKPVEAKPAEPAQKPKRRIEPTLISKKSSGFWCCF